MYLFRVLFYFKGGGGVTGGSRIPLYRNCHFLFIVDYVDGNIDKALAQHYQEIKDEFSIRWAKHKCEVK